MKLDNIIALVKYLISQIYYWSILAIDSNNNIFSDTAVPRSWYARGDMRGASAEALRQSAVIIARRRSYPFHRAHTYDAVQRYRENYN